MHGGDRFQEIGCLARVGAYLPRRSRAGFYSRAVVEDAAAADTIGTAIREMNH
jgi:hypothetical protein